MSTCNLPMAQDPFVMSRFADDGTWHVCKWSEWKAANSDIADDVESYLAVGRVYIGGGGAAPIFEVRRT